MEQARNEHIDALRKLRSGINPLRERKEQKRAELASAENTFQGVAERWYEKNKKGKSNS